MTLVYGVEHYAQTIEYHKRKRHKYTTPKYPGVSFDSTWEIIVYDYLSSNKISFEYQPCISFHYEYDGKHFTYHPDFRVGDNIVEVKGDHYFRINEETGKEEMYKPHRNKRWSDERYEWECAKEEAKHQCMIMNNVIILRRKQIESILVNINKSTIEVI